MVSSGRSETNHPQIQSQMNAEEAKCYLVTIPDKLFEARELIKSLRASLNDMRHNVDVSTINNSKRSTARWEDLVRDAEHNIAMATKFLEPTP